MEKTNCDEYRGGGVLRRGGLLQNIRGRQIHLEGVYSELGPPDLNRPVIRSVELQHLSAGWSSLTGSILEDVVIDGLESIGHPVLCFANEFRRVRLSGSIRTLIVNQRHSDPAFRREYTELLRVEDLKSEVSLDISEAIGKIAIRGYSARRIVRNPAIHAVVRWENLLDGRWREVDLNGTAFPVLLEEMLDYGWSDVILIADPTSPSFGHEIDAIRRFRDEGIAEVA